MPRPLDTTHLPTWHEIVPGLWMGASHRTPDASFDVVVSLDEWAAARTPAPATAEEHVLGMDDVVHLPVDWVTLPRAIDIVLDALDAGRTVLVRCNMGVNRSGPVVGEVLAAFSHDRSQIVELIRERRDRVCLSNSRFESVLRGDLAA